MGESISAAGIEAGHTPGPWRNAGRLGFATLIVGQRGDEQICCVYGPSVTPEAAANSALIAAAPEMLDALRTLDRVLNKPGVPMHSDAVQAAIESARAAIARAEGRA